MIKIHLSVFHSAEVSTSGRLLLSWKARSPIWRKWCQSCCGRYFTESSPGSSDCLCHFSREVYWWKPTARFPVYKTKIMSSKNFISPGMLCKRAEKPCKISNQWSLWDSSLGCAVFPICCWRQGLLWKTLNPMRSRLTSGRDSHFQVFVWTILQTGLWPTEGITQQS